MRTRDGPDKVCEHADGFVSLMGEGVELQCVCGGRGFVQSRTSQWPEGGGGGLCKAGKTDRLPAVNLPMHQLACMRGSERMCVVRCVNKCKASDFCVLVWVNKPGVNCLSTCDTFNSCKALPCFAHPLFPPYFYAAFLFQALSVCVYLIVCPSERQL